MDAGSPLRPSDILYERAAATQHRFTRGNITGYDLTVPLGQQATLAEETLRDYAIAHTLVDAADASRCTLYVAGTREAVSRLALHMDPMVVHEVAAKIGLITEATRMSPDIDYINLIAEIILATVQGSSLARQAENQTKILIDLSKTAATFSSISKGILEVRRVDAAYRPLAINTIFSSLAHAPIHSPAISYIVQSMCAQVDAALANDGLRMQHLELLCTRVGELERTAPPPKPIADQQRQAGQPSKKAQQKDKKKVWPAKTPPPEAGPKPTVGVIKNDDGIVCCGYCKKPTTWSMVDKAWHTSSNCRRKAASNASSAKGVEASDVAFESIEHPEVYAQYAPSSHGSTASTHTTSQCKITTQRASKRPTPDVAAHIGKAAPRVRTASARRRHARAAMRTQKGATSSALCTQKAAAPSVPCIPPLLSSSSPHLIDDSDEIDLPYGSNEDYEDYLEAISSTESQANVAKRPSSSSLNMLDGGCGPAHVFDVKHAVGATRSSDCTIIGVRGIRLNDNLTGKAKIFTVNAEGINVSVILPGETLFPKNKVDANLISHSTLLNHGWTVDLNRLGGDAVSPSGMRFYLEKRGSCWYFPQQHALKNSPFSARSERYKESRRINQAAALENKDKTATCAPPIKNPKSIKHTDTPSNSTAEKRGSCAPSPMPSNRYTLLSMDKTDTEESAQGQHNEAIDKDVSQAHLKMQPPSTTVRKPALKRSKSQLKADAKKQRRVARASSTSPPSGDNNDAATTTPTPSRPTSPSLSNVSSATTTFNDEKQMDTETTIKDFMNPLTLASGVELASPKKSVAFAVPSDGYSSDDPPELIKAEESDDEDDEISSPSGQDMTDDLDKWDVIHRSHDHVVWKRMYLIAKAMDPSDPNRPRLHTLKHWIKIRGCGACKLSKPIKPPQSATHPRSAHDASFKPGEYLWVDGVGSFNKDEPCIDGYTTGFVITDYSSNAITFIPVLDKKPTTLIRILNEYQARSGVKIRKIRTDNEYVTSETKDWAAVEGIDLSGSAPRTQQQNGLSERSVRTVKDGNRAARILACTNDCLIADGYLNAAQQHNRAPSLRDPLGQKRSPLQQFPTLPFEHRTLPTHPFGCRCYPLLGKIPGRKSSESRAIAGVYLCHDRYTAGYRILNQETNTVEVHAYADFKPSVFPIRELLLQGEPPNQDIDPDS